MIYIIFTVVFVAALIWAVISHNKNGIKYAKKTSIKRVTSKGKLDSSANVEVDEDGRLKCPRCSGFKAGKKPQYRFRTVKKNEILECRKCGFLIHNNAYNKTCEEIIR